jgi:hypothetical protein
VTETTIQCAVGHCLHSGDQCEAAGQCLSVSNTTDRAVRANLESVARMEAQSTVIRMANGSTITLMPDDGDGPFRTAAAISLADRTSSDERDLIVKWLREKAAVMRKNGRHDEVIATIFLAAELIEEGAHANV